MMSRTWGSVPSSYCRSYSDTSPLSRSLTGRIQAPALCPSNFRPATQRPLSLREFARQSMRWTSDIGRRKARRRNLARSSRPRNTSHEATDAVRRVSHPGAYRKCKWWWVRCGARGIVLGAVLGRPSRKYLESLLVGQIPNEKEWAPASHPPLEGERPLGWSPPTPDWRVLPAATRRRCWPPCLPASRPRESARRAACCLSSSSPRGRRTRRPAPSRASRCTRRTRGLPRWPGRSS